MEVIQLAVGKNMNSKISIIIACLLATVSGQAFIGVSPKASFYLQSEDNNTWENWSFSAIVGFAMLLVAFTYTVVMVFLDIKKNGENYDELIHNDLATMSQLGLDNKRGEIQKELEERLAGVKKEDGIDDQLLGEAAKMDSSKFGKYM